MKEVDRRQSLLSGSELSFHEIIRKVVTFELALKRPWLEELSSEKDEKLRLEASCRHSSHRIVTRSIDQLLALNGLELRRGRVGSVASTCHRQGAPRNRLKIMLMGRNGEEKENVDVHANRGLQRLRRLVKVRSISTLLLICSFAYTSWPPSSTAYLLLQHDIMLARMRPTVLPAPNGSGLVNGSHDGCAIKQLIKYDPAYDERRFIEINRRLDAVGEPIRSQTGARLMTHTMLGLTPALLFFLTLLFVLLRGHLVRLDMLAFVYDPQEERARLFGELTQIIDGLLVGLLKGGHESKYLLSPNNAQSSLHPTSSKRDRDILRLRSLRNADNLEFLHLLEESHNESSLVRPLVVSSEWHHLMERFFILAASALLAVSLGTINIALLAENLVELHARVEHRLKSIECRRWHADGMFLGSSMMLEPLSAKEMEPYESYDGSWSHLMNLMFAKELPHLWASIARLTITLAPVNCFLSIWSCFWTSSYIICFIDKISWLIQIKRQLEWCDQQSRWPTASHQVAQRRRLIMGRLLSVYLNYELYRRQHEPFRVLSNFLLLQASLVVGVFSLALYAISTNMDIKDKTLVVISSVGIVIFFNIYLGFASYNSKLIEEIMQMLMKILAALAQTPELSLRPVLDVWRRQLLSEQDLKKFAATRALGFSVTYQSLIAFNVNILGLLLLLWKAFGTRL